MSKGHMSRWGKTIIWVTAAASLGANVGAEGLAEAAKREKERRGKAKNEQPAKTYDEAALRSAVGASATQVEGPALSTEAPARAPVKCINGVSSSSDPKEVQACKIAMLEKHVRCLERERAEGPRSGGRCVPASMVPLEARAPGLRDVPPNVDMCGLAVPEDVLVQAIEADLKPARAALDYLRRTLP